jgi:hypothetical protein
VRETQSHLNRSHEPNRVDAVVDGARREGAAATT